MGGLLLGLAACANGWANTVPDSGASSKACVQLDVSLAHRPVQPFVHVSVAALLCSRRWRVTKRRLVSIVARACAAGRIPRL
jgi:hypothetical protein